MELSFIERGVIAAILIGFIAPMVGSFLAVRRSSIISDSLSHVTLTGISAGVLLGQTWNIITINPLYTGFIFALIGSLVIEKLRQTYHHFQELAAPIILSAGVGLSAVIMSASKSGYSEWYDYLFGSVVSVTEADLMFIVITSITVILIFFLFYKELISVSFDQEYASVSGISIKHINFVFSLLVALVISMSMKVVGILLVGALVSLPVASALQIAKSFKKTLIWGIVLAETAVLTGVYFSYHFNIATGGTIVVASSVILLMVLMQNYVQLFVNRRKQ
ncbi:zinc transport system permease protein [Alteribacillus persepolensis]|uniref:Zinc transport system permease protein n=1 Tax=Alteribacillus persepolensis TaxID=568899 RepID=A0A1G8CUF6_9BACI|nr:metal ABC transporter permease [Alteribacillus persepolensis]SDH48894.1 zinc transport system permease protein [Alteribacillus persepolensis]